MHSAAATDMLSSIEASVRETVLVVESGAEADTLLYPVVERFGYTAFPVMGAGNVLSDLVASGASILVARTAQQSDAARILRNARDVSPHLEAIFVTDDADPHAALSLLRAGATDVLPAPVSADLLDIALAKAAERVALRKQVREYTENLEQLVQEKSARLVAMERRLAARQIVEGLASGMRIITEDVADAESFLDMPFYVSIHDGKGSVLTCNRLYREKFGDKAGRPSCEIYRDCSGAKNPCPVREARETKKGHRRRETLIAADGSEVPALVYASPVANRDDEVELVLEIAVDTSEVERLRAELKRAQRRYEDLFNQVPCFITVQDRDLRIVDANRRFREAFGFERGAACHELYKRRSEPCDDCPILKTFEDGRSHQHETVVTSRTGEQLNLLVWTAPITNEKGEITHVIETSTDITQLRKLQDHLSSLGIMLGSMSHGLKGLLTAMDGGTYRVDSGLINGDLARIEAGWKTVKHRLAHIRKSVMDILYFSKTRELDVSEVSLREFSENLASLAADKAGQHGVAFTADLTGAAGTFHADETALTSALLNFLENAVDACVFDRAKPEHAARFSARRENGEIVFEIRDNGTGMDAETREKMFTLFFSSKGAQGTGIGMFVSHHVIARHGGDIRVESREGEGTVFVVRVPERPETASGPLEDSPAK